MTVARSWDLQKALFARLTEALAGKGRGGSDVPVFDHAPHAPPPLYVRIDGGHIADESLKNCPRAGHRLDIHVFDRPAGQATQGRGQRAVKELQAVIYTALHDWRPFPGQGAIRHDETSIDADEDGVTQHGFSYFRIKLGDAP